ncbi:wax ester/triacylglycerol synthase domain-containing protein [Aldersonia kunmingensis]|uniref:wax ester/triacylglycerol synthase domain-containing protein n=1 Tax=Aldersonia kunmingensis TaxID=408066 RepID=UPI00082A66D2|nr:wax ester/triacylglycerol synthase domain-containing protein [Aldersonia kunmingensis]
MADHDSDPERLSADDAHILGLESAAVTGHTLKLVVLEPSARALDIDSLRAIVAERLPQQPRATQRIDTSGEYPRWVEDTEFDIAHHVRQFPDGCANRADLWRAVSSLMSEHLDRAYPLWTFDVLGPLDNGRTAIAVRMHHAMCDGIAGVRFVDTVLFDPHDAPAAKGGVHPDREPVSRAAEARRLPAAVWRELGHLGSRSPFDRPITVARELAFTVVPLAEMKAIGSSRPQHATVNDVLLTAISGGLRKWLDRHGESRQRLRVQIPVSLHHADEGANLLGNRDSFLNLDLPLGISDPLERLDLISAQTRERKQLDDADELYNLFHALGTVKSIGAVAHRLAGSSREWGVSISNVPGPALPRSVAGRRLIHLFSSSEPAAHHALRIAAISFDGNIGIGLCTDPNALSHIDRMADAIHEAHVEVREAAGVSP